MRILVTGHDGYIGAVLVPMLLRDGHQVVGLDSSLYERADFTAAPPLAEVPRIHKDLRDLVADDVRGFDAVIHLAALSNDPLGNLDASLTRQINFEASLRCAELAKAGGTRRFLFSSSCSTYGAAGDEMLDESAAFRPVTPYAVEKVNLERALAELADDDFSPVYLRNATAYGVSRRLRLDIVLNNLVGWAHTTGRVLLLSDGTPWRPIVHVEDICRAFLAALAAPRELVHDEAFNVGRSEHNYRILELAEIVAETVPGARVEIASDAGPDARSYRVDFRKIEEKLPGFQPQWDARRSARELYDAYRRFGLRRDHLERSPFVRLAELERRIHEGEIEADLRPRVHAL
ncbi:MAG: SDR family NAD-dependent epimerase/dehydratase [Acidobacteria bacterium]|nr:MAG: SDR family NAD-dependent epimerase/dehydratase [Acidobacteriota bacterium]REK10668.1 MAG: SDR family NAD-dependent epimerase/dehydratase [Acidobacteriota bacterium]